MGYEVIFTAFDKNTDGKGYNLENPSTFTKKVGSAVDDVSLEEVATMVLKQMARRDKFISEVEVYEYTKKKISFKETDGGILLKNKKFILDPTSIKSADVTAPVPESAQNIQYQPTAPLMQTGRYEVFDSDPAYINLLARKGILMTAGQKYCIIGEETTMMKINDNGSTMDMPCLEYTVQDNNGRNAKIPSIHFVPVPRGLVGQELIDREMSNRMGGPKLLYQQGSGQMQMPDLYTHLNR